MSVPNVSAAVEARDVEIVCCDNCCIPHSLSKYVPKFTRDEATSPTKPITPTTPPPVAPKIVKLSILKPKLHDSKDPEGALSPKV